MNRLTSKLSLLSHSAYYNNVLGVNAFSFLIVLDYAIYGILLILGSYPHSKTIDKELDYVNTSDFEPYLLSE